MRMNWDRIEGSWRHFRNNVKDRSGKLTDDRPDVSAGRRKERTGETRAPYGISKHALKRQRFGWQSPRNVMDNLR